MRKIRKMAQKDLKETEEEMERRWEKNQVYRTLNINVTSWWADTKSSSY